MRSIWSGSISFGLVHIPVQLFTAVQDVGVHFNLLSPDGTCRLKQKLYCPDTGEEFEYSQASRGFEVAPDEFVIVRKEDLAKLRPESGKTIAITDFVSAEEIDAIYFDRPYHLLPDPKARKPYRLLLEAIRESGKVAVAKFVLRTKGYWCVIRPVGHMLRLHTMHEAGELVDTKAWEDDLASIEVDKRELAAAGQLVGALVGDFDPTKYKDEYAIALREMIDRLAAGETIAAPDEPAPPRAPGAPDLMEVLRRSVEAVRSSRKAASPVPPREASRAGSRESARDHEASSPWRAPPEVAGDSRAGAGRDASRDNPTQRVQKAPKRGQATSARPTPAPRAPRPARGAGPQDEGTDNALPRRDRRKATDRRRKP